MSTVSQVDVFRGGSRRDLQLTSWLPVVAPIVSALFIVFLRVKFGHTGFLDDSTLIVLALICYLVAAVIGLTDLYAAQAVLGRWGIWLASTGLMFNAAAWGARWIQRGDNEHWVRWVFRYVPFANLYDLSIAFTIGAGLATVIICRKQGQRAIMGISTLLASVIIMMAIFMGNEFVNLQPVLDSYWRPIHVGIASLSYGVTLVCFSIAVLYLVKDGVKIEAMAIFVAICGILLYAFLDRRTLFSQGHYGLYVNVSTGDASGITPFRADIPYVGALMIVAAILLAVTLVCFGLDFYRNEQKLGRFGHLAFRGSALFQASSLGILFYQIKYMTGIGSHIDVASQVHFPEVAKFAEGAPIGPVAAINGYLQNSGNHFSISPSSNPVELGGLFALLAMTGLVALFTFRTDRIIQRLPSLQRLDGLVYRTAAIAFIGLAMLLITGAVWANESWGRYWGWDSKETGAFVAWVAYAGYMHTRVAHGWSGRKSAYFAIAGFLLVILTYLGVSYIFPGLHSYA